MESRHMHYTFRYSLVVGLYWITFIPTMNYSSLYLKEVGLNYTLIGLIVFLGELLPIFISPVLAGFADRSETFSLKKLVLVISGIPLLLWIVKKLCGLDSASVNGFLLGICITASQLLYAFIMSLGTKLLNHGFHVNIGAARGTGSLTYAICSIVTGKLVGSLGNDSVLPITLVYFALTFAAALQLPFPARSWNNPDSKQVSSGKKDWNTDDRENINNHKDKLSLLSFLQKYPSFARILPGMMLINLCNCMPGTYLYQIVVSKGGGSPELGIVMFLIGIMEIPTIFGFSLLLKRWDCDVWFRIGVIFVVLKQLMMLLVPSVPALYAVQFLQMLGWGLISIAPIYYVNRVVSFEDSIKGQAYLAIAGSVGTSVGTLIGGFLMDLGGVTIMLLTAIIAGAFGILNIWRHTERLEKKGY